MLKTFDLAPKTGFANFFVFAKIFAKKCVRVVNDYADTVTLSVNFEGFAQIFNPLVTRATFVDIFSSNL